MTPSQTPPIRYHGRMAPLQLNAEIVRVTLQGSAEGEASNVSGFEGYGASVMVGEL